MPRHFLAVFCCALVLAACQPSEGPAPVDPAVEAAVVEQPAAAPAVPVAGALKSPLPEGFELPFGFHRIYDNTGVTETGSPQRRILGEYLDVDAGVVQSSLAAALREKGFSAPEISMDDDAIELVFARDDGASVIAKITPGRENPRASNAKGLFHLTWNAA